MPIKITMKIVTIINTYKVSYELGSILNALSQNELIKP